MGCNAIRCSHNPMAPELYDLCDRLGPFVMDEAFDDWTDRKPQVKFGYSDVFNDWLERTLVDFIRRDRNHPSIVMWSAGNEIGEQRDEKGPAILGQLAALFHREDGHTRSLFNGMAMALLQSTTTAGPLQLTACTEGIPWGTVTIETRPAR